MPARKPRPGQSRDLVQLAAALVGSAAAAQAVNPQCESCCEYHEDVEAVQCCEACPNEDDERLRRHDGDCQMAQHTYVHQGAPGVFVHGTRTDGGFMLDAVGTNGRRLLVRDDADGIYLGGVVLTDVDALKLAAHLELMATRRRARS